MTRARPVFDMLRAQKGRTSFHMPGHGGKGILPLYMDTTELPSTGNLKAGDGAYESAQRSAAAALGFECVRFVTGGATLAIQAMLLAVSMSVKKIIIQRSAHVSAYNSCALWGITPEFVMPKPAEDGLYETDERDLLKALDENPDAGALFITSPDYYGRILETETLHKECKARGRLLLVDAAHGAHLPFFGINIHGDVVAMSAHKTLPALTMAALLAVNGPEMIGKCKTALDMLMTSSPSSLLCASIEKALALFERPRTIVGFTKRIEGFWGICPFPDANAAIKRQCDPARMAIDVSDGGQSGFFARDFLSKRGIDVEMADERRIVCIPSVNTTEKDYRSLAQALRHMPQSAQPQAFIRPPYYAPPLIAMPLSKAAFAEREHVDLRRCAGRISAVCAGVYPPGIPLVAPGEIITEGIARQMSNFREKGADLFGVTAREIGVIKT